jgi:hypothetical protein
LGEDCDDLRDDLSGLPLERMMGVLGVRGSELVCGGEGGTERDPVTGDEVGKGTALVEEEEGGRPLERADLGMLMKEGGSTEGEKRPDWMERRRELIGE